MIQSLFVLFPPGEDFLFVENFNEPIKREEENEGRNAKKASRGIRNGFNLNLRFERGQEGSTNQQNQ